MLSSAICIADKVWKARMKSPDLDQSCFERGSSVDLAKAAMSSMDWAGGVLYPAPQDPLELPSLSA